MSADVDCARAWITRWRATAALDTAVPGGITSDRLTESRPLATVPERAAPYAQLEVKAGKAKQYVSGGDYIDYRRVSVFLYGVGKEALGKVVSLIHATFDSPATLDFSFSPAVKGHMRTEPLDDTEGPDQAKKQGEDYRKADAEFLVWTHRQSG